MPPVSLADIGEEMPLRTKSSRFSFTPKESYYQMLWYEPTVDIEYTSEWVHYYISVEQSAGGGSDPGAGTMCYALNALPLVCLDTTGVTDNPWGPGISGFGLNSFLEAIEFTTR
eukprot:3896429-Rhodomonas_salina.1